MRQVRSIGKRDCGNLFKLGDELIQFGGLHALLAASVADMLPVSPGVLLSDDAKRLARSTKGRDGDDVALDVDRSSAAKSFEGLMSSPWKVPAYILEFLEIEDRPLHLRPLPGLLLCRHRYL